MNWQLECMYISDIWINPQNEIFESFYTGTTHVTFSDDPLYTMLLINQIMNWSTKQS